MTAKYQIEALLRPAVEIWSAFIAGTMATLLYLIHHALYLPESLAVSAGVMFTMYGTWRLTQGIRIVMYRWHLKHLPRYTLMQNRIPVSNSTFFIGRGFLWKARHTQRLRDCGRTEAARWLAEPGQQKLIHRLSLALDKVNLQSWGRYLIFDHPLNPFRPLPAVGGRPELHGVGLWEGEAEVNAPLTARIGHTLVLGTTGVGKTRLAELLVNQDIRRGDTVIVLDPKGDTELLASMHAACRQAGRLMDFIVFHMAYPDYSARYNPIGDYSRITQVATRIANSLPSDGNSAAFREFGWRFVNVVVQALVSLGEIPTYARIHRHIMNVDGLLVRYGKWWLARTRPEDWEQRVELISRSIQMNSAERSRDFKAVCIARVLIEGVQQADGSDPVVEGLLSAFRYERTYFDKITASLAPFLEKLSTGAASELFSPVYEHDDPRPLFEWRTVIERGGVVYVGLAALQDTMVASAVGNAMFADLVSVAGELYAHGSNPNVPRPSGEPSPSWKPVSIHADEFNEIIGDEFIPLLNKARGVGYQVTAYTQTWSDVEARVGSHAKAMQVAGNFNTLILLRVRHKETAELLVDLLPTVQVSQITTVSTAQHQADPGSTRHFGSSVQDRVTSTDVSLLDSGDLTRLPIGQCFLLMEGAQLWKLRLPLIRSTDQVPVTIEEITRHMLPDRQPSGPGTSEAVCSISDPDNRGCSIVAPTEHPSLATLTDGMRIREPESAPLSPNDQG